MHPLLDKLQYREEKYSSMIRHSPIIKHFISGKVNIIQHIGWVNSLNNEIFYSIEMMERKLMLGHFKKH